MNPERESEKCEDEDATRRNVGVQERGNKPVALGVEVNQSCIGMQYERKIGQESCLDQAESTEQPASDHQPLHNFFDFVAAFANVIRNEIQERVADPAAQIQCTECCLPDREAVLGFVWYQGDQAPGCKKQYWPGQVNFHEWQTRVQQVRVKVQEDER